MPFQPFDALSDAAQHDPDGLFFADSTQTLTFREALGIVCQFAGQLRILGVKPGDTVAIELPIGMQVLFSYAALHVAAVSATVSRNNSPQGVDWDWWLTSDPSESLPARTVVRVDNEFLIRAAGLTTSLKSTPFGSDDSVCRIALTSGTTGLSKAVSLTTTMVEHRVAEATRLFEGEGPFLCTLGLATTSGFHTMIASTKAGLPYLAPLDGPANRDTIRRFGVSAIKSSPQQISDIVTASASDRLESLRKVYSAGGKPSLALVNGVRSVSDAEFVNLYGSSEAGRAAESTGVTGTDPTFAGKVVPGVSVEVVDDDGNNLPLGTTGTIRYRADHMATEYAGDSEASAKAFRDGWFYPGDTGRVEPDGSLYLEGRTSDTLNAGGVKIDPSVFEQFATTLPGVTEALGFTHTNELGVPQFVLAVVAQGAAIADVSRAVEERFGQSRPSALFSIPAIPLTETGKPSRYLTAELFAETHTRPIR